MEVLFDKNSCKYLTNLIENPGVRKHIRKFEQEYQKLKADSMEQKIKGMRVALNGKEYNDIYNDKNEGLEVLQGIKDKDNHEFKTRIEQTNPHRMGMFCIDYLACSCTCEGNHLCSRDCSQVIYLSRKNWKETYAGDYKKVTHLYVSKLHHHDY